MLKSEKKQFMTSLEELLFKGGKNPNGVATSRPGGAGGGAPPKKAKRASVPEPKKLNVSSDFAAKLAQDFGKRKLGGEQQKRVQEQAQAQALAQAEKQPEVKKQKQPPVVKKKRSPPEPPPRKARQQLPKDLADDTPRLSKTAWELFKAQYGEGGTKMNRRSGGKRAPTKNSRNSAKKSAPPKAKEPQQVKKEDEKQRPPQRTLPGGSKSNGLLKQAEQKDAEAEVKPKVTTPVEAKKAKTEEKTEVKAVPVKEPSKQEAKTEEKLNVEETETKPVEKLEEEDITKTTETAPQQAAVVTGGTEETLVGSETEKELSKSVEEQERGKNEVKGVKPKSEGSSMLRVNESGIQEMDDAVFHEINELRTNPKAYIPMLEKELEIKRYDRSAVEEAIGVLKAKEPTMEMEWSKELSQAAELHVSMTGEAGDFGHIGTDDSTPIERIHKFDTNIGAMSSLLRFGGMLSPQDLVVGFLIDESDAQRRNRQTLFGFWEKFGCFTGAHVKSKHMTTLHFAQTKSSTKQLVNIAVAAWEENIEEPEGYSAENLDGWVRKDQEVRQNQGIITVTNTYYFKDGEPQVIEATIKHYRD